VRESEYANSTFSNFLLRIIEKGQQNADLIITFNKAFSSSCSTFKRKLEMNSRGYVFPSLQSNI
jgi:hypothetical protein